MHRNYRSFNLVNKEGRITIDALKWGGHAKKSGIEIGDVISEFKIENLDRPNRATIYPFSLLILFVFGYLNYRSGKKIWSMTKNFSDKNIIKGRWYNINKKIKKK